MKSCTSNNLSLVLLTLALTIFICQNCFAQPTGPGRGGMPGGDMPARGARGGRGMMGMPRAGVAPLPILPALPAYDDANFYSEKDVPHGKVEQVTYTNNTGQEKRMHIYLPPGYEDDTETRYPVLYLNHGGGDDDSKWSSHDRSGGYADFILDNLIAEGKAKPMIIVMPDTRQLATFTPPAPDVNDACAQEYLEDIIPYVDSHYRTKADRDNRALAGLSMGGIVVLNTGLPHLETFSQLYVYSSGYIQEADREDFVEKYKELFENPDATNDLFRVPFYMAAGERDSAMLNSQRLLAFFNQASIRNFWVLSSGGHEWPNWRRYLYQTAQIMFPEDEN